MYVSRYQVFDQGILTISNVRLSARYPHATETQLELNLFRGEDTSALYRPAERCLTVSRPAACDHTLRLLLAYLAGLRSEVYDAVHAAGVVVDGRGVLCVGGHGSGKSTLLGLFPDAPVLDDDVIVTDGETMYGTSGNDTSEHRIDLVLLLRPKEAGGNLTPAPPQIPRATAVFDSLPPPLPKYYRSLRPIPVDAPVHVLGTRSDLPRTREAVLDALALG